MTLADCGDTLGIPELCALLGLSQSEYYKLKAHGVFPIPPLSFGGTVRRVRYSKVAVQRYLDQGATPGKLRRVG